LIYLFIGLFIFSSIKFVFSSIKSLIIFEGPLRQNVRAILDILFSQFEVSIKLENISILPNYNKNHTEIS